MKPTTEPTPEIPPLVISGSGACTPPPEPKESE